MAQARDITFDLERHRQVLEETVSALQKSLQVWEQWYIEYSHLKEELTTLPTQPPSRVELARIRRDFDSPLVTKKEIGEIFGKPDLKKPEQILSVLSRRIDYVERNVETLEKQLEATERKLAASNVLAEPDGVVDEESGLPITDIIEEIDGEGNVVGFRLQTGGEVGGKVLEALKGVGVDSLEEAEEGEAKDDASEGKVDGEPVPEAKVANGILAKNKVSDGKSTTNGKPKPKPKRKSVTFAEELEQFEETNAQDDENDVPKSRVAIRLEAIMQQARDLENLPLDSANVPEDETEDDAQLRREMLDYSASEIGPIVAELELDEGPTDDDEDYDYTEDEDGDSEDELGRTKHSVISDDYIKRMQELEKRLGVESAFASERNAQLEVPVEGLGQIRVVRPTAEQAFKPATSAVVSESSAKKGVRFANDLDVADETAPTTVLTSRPATKPAPEPNPISEVVTERTSNPAPSTPSAPTKKPSRFKKSLTTTPALPAGPLSAPVRFLDEDRTVAPSGPEGKTLADGVLEREVEATPKDPDEMDATLLHQEAAVEYHRVRNRMIQKEGGFNKEDDRVKVPIDEEEGGPRRVSRFKAARLGRQ